MSFNEYDAHGNVVVMLTIARSDCRGVVVSTRSLDSRYRQWFPEVETSTFSRDVGRQLLYFQIQFPSLAKLYVRRNSLRDGRFSFR